MKETAKREMFFYPFQKSSKARWLVREKILCNILVNWEELHVLCTRLF